MPLERINKTLMKKRFERSAPSYDAHAVVQARMARKLIDAAVTALDLKGCGRVFEIGCGTGILTRLLAEWLRPARLIANDIVGDFRSDIRAIVENYPGMQVEFRGGDIETLPLPVDLDLVAANAVFQWLEDLDLLYGRLADNMTHGAAMVFSTFGAGNLEEMSAITNLSLHYPSQEEHCRLLGKRFEIIDTWEERQSLRLDSPLEVLRHLKATGVNALSTERWVKKDLAAFSHEYKRRFSCHQQVTLTYHPLFFIARLKR